MTDNKKKLSAALFLLAALAGCEKKAESIEAVGVDNAFQVEKLFTHEGCTVYRFADNGRSRYYTNCIGAASWAESCGKSCARPVEINGGRHD